jgi:protein TonB
MAFDAFLYQEKAKPKKMLRIALTVAVALHAGLVTAGGIHSFWHVDELSGPNVAVTFLSGTPPPPPPPPPPKKKKSTPTHKPVEVVQPKANSIVQPKEKEEPPEEEDDGVEGGVEGGVAGGTLGSVPTQQETAKLLPPNVGSGQLISDVKNDPRYRPSLPPALNRSGMRVWGLFKICVSAAGAVSNVSILKSADKLVDNEWMAKIRTWQYRPYSINGRPVPFCHPMRLEVQSQ